MSAMNDIGFGYWAISGEALLAALFEAYEGGNPNLIYLELYANTSSDDDE